MTKFLLGAVLALLLVPAVADASPFLHKSEAALEQAHRGYAKADTSGAFHIAFGGCVRHERSAVACTVSMWRTDAYGIQLRCNYVVKVSKRHRRGRDVRSRMPGYCGKADPVVAGPKPVAGPSFPSYEQGSDYSPGS